MPLSTVCQRRLATPIAAAYIADLAAWVEAHQAVSVEGAVRVPLPPGMTERVMDGSTTNGHAYRHDASGVGMWSMVVRYPADDDPDDIAQIRQNIGNG